VFKLSNQSGCQKISADFSDNIFLATKFLGGRESNPARQDEKRELSAMPTP